MAHPRAGSAGPPGVQLSRGAYTEAMKSSLSLGRVAGIQIGLDWSVLVLLALLMWTLATSIFPDTNPGLSDNAYFGMAVVASLAFFASILLHELGHALQARRDGMEIDGITLWIFGGIARFRGMFTTAGSEFRIAVAGPIVSLVLAAGFLGVALIPGIPVHVDAVCSWLGFTNLVLLIFNLIPALPLDGGRMLRAALWQGTGDLRRATRISAATGKVLAAGLIGVGVLMAVTVSLVSGVWLAIIGWFVLQAAGAEGRYVEMEARRAMRVRDMMSTDLVAVGPDETLADVAERTARHGGLAAFPVIDEGRVVGMLTVVNMEAVPREAWEYHRVADHMTDRDHVPTLTADDPLDTAVAALASSHLQRAFILDGERLVGLLSIADIAKTLGVSTP